MNTKFTLAIVALVGIGVFALPSTMSLFAGQHSFYNIDATGNQVPCQKCHGDVKAELSSSGLSTLTGTKGPHADFQCEYCHRAENGMSSGDDAYAKITYSSAAGAKIYLVTNIYNFENGNFPKGINYQAGMTVDNWANNIFDINGTAFTPYNGSEVGSGNDTNYSGSLSTNGVAGTLYNYSYSSETSLYKNGAPKDQNLVTQKTGFAPRLVTWVGTAENLNGTGSREVTPGTKYHAASLVSCLECHGGEQKKGLAGYEISTPEPYNHAGWLVDPTNPNSGCQNCHYGNASHTDSFEADLAAGGFGLTTNANDTGSSEAHKSFVTTNDGINRFGYGASNGACVACHTHVAVDINFAKGYKLSFNATESSAGVYNVGGFQVEGKVNVSTYGNSDGSVYGVSNESYTWAGATMYVNGSNSMTNIGLKATANDSLGALQAGP